MRVYWKTSSGFISSKSFDHFKEMRRFVNRLMYDCLIDEICIKL